MLLLLLAGCSSIFDGEAGAMADLERYAREHQQYDRGPMAQIRYLFVDNPATECRANGLQQAYAAGKVEACAVLTDPCIIILPWAPTRRMVTEEQLHCRYGAWHGP